MTQDFYSDELSWLLKNDAGQIHWAETYLIKKGLLHPYTEPPQLSLNDRYYHVEYTLKNLSEDSYQRYFFIKRMKTAWNQKKYRTTHAGKKNYNFELPKNSGEALARLAKATKRSRSAVIEDLIHIAVESSVATQKYDPMARYDEMILGFEQKVSDGYASTTREDRLLISVFEKFEKLIFEEYFQLACKLERQVASRGDVTRENAEVIKKINRLAVQHQQQLRDKLNMMPSYKALKDRQAGLMLNHQ